jgi:hypothetical protein
MAKQKKSAFERLSSGAMNRRQRRDLARRLAGNDPGLTIVHSNAGGIDVGMRLISWRCLRTGTRTRCRSSAAGQPI